MVDVPMRTPLARTLTLALDLVELFIESHALGTQPAEDREAQHQGAIDIPLAVELGEPRAGGYQLSGMGLDHRQCSASASLGFA